MFKRITTKQLVLCGMFVALDIICARFLSIPISPTQKLSLGFVSHVTCAYILGPIPAALTLIASDVLGFFINSGGYSFFPGYLLSAAMFGLIYGFAFHKKPVEWPRTIAAVVLATVVVTFGLGNLWTSMFMSSTFWAIAIQKLPFTALYCAVACIVSQIVLSAISRIEFLKVE